METGLRKFRRAVIIGLGGSGQKVLVNLKRMLIDSLGEVPPCIRLLCFDTSSQKDTAYSLHEGKTIELSDHEFFHMSCVDPVSFIKSSKSVQEWFIDMPVDRIVDGAHGYRQVGRIGLYANLDMVRSRLNQAFDHIMLMKTIDDMNKKGWDIDQDKQPEVYIASSLAGGTGSGTFIDLGMISRCIFPTCTISGYFILPWIYTQYPGTARVRGNTYAALKELDFLMSMGISDRNLHKVNFGGFTKEIDRPPYNLFHLIDGRNINGTRVKEPSLLASIIANGIFLTLGAVGGVANDIIDNLLRMLGDIPEEVWGGKCARYTSMGTASIRYPARELHLIKSLEDLCATTDELVATVQIETPMAVQPTADADASVRTIIDKHGLWCGREGSFEERILSVQDLELAVRLSENTPFSKAHIIGLLDNKAQSKQEDLQEPLKEAQRRADDTAGAIATTITQEGDKLLTQEKEGKKPSGAARTMFDQLSETFTQLRKQFEQEKGKSQKTVQDCTNQKEHLKGAVESVKFFYLKSQKIGACQAYMDNANAVTMAKARIAQIDLCTGVIDKVVQYIEQAGVKYPTAKALKSQEADMLARISKRLKDDLEEARKNLNKLETDLFTGIIQPQDDGYKSQMSRRGFATDALFAQTTRRDFFNRPFDKIFDDMIKCAKFSNEWILKNDVCKVLMDLGEEKFNHQIERLLQRSVPMIMFDRGQISEERQEYIVPISIVALPDLLYKQKIDTVISALRSHYSLRYEPNYVQTVNAKLRDICSSQDDNPYTISILNYFSAVPAYSLEDIEEYKQRYESTLKPSSHIGKDFEFNTADLFPGEHIASKALKVVTFALIPAIGIIKDDKLDKGHRYTISTDLLIDEEEPRRYETFNELVNCVEADDDLCDALSKALVKFSDKIEMEGRDFKKIPDIIKPYLKEMERRFNSRDFTHMLAGRFYAYEIRYLKEYLAQIPEFVKRNEPNPFTLKKYIQGQVTIA